MNFEFNSTSLNLALKGIPTARRHFYFYTVLLLTTVLAHNIWTYARSPQAPSQIAQQAEELALIDHMAQAALP